MTLVWLAIGLGLAVLAITAPLRWSAAIVAFWLPFSGTVVAIVGGSTPILVPVVVVLGFLARHAFSLLIRPVRQQFFELVRGDGVILATASLAGILAWHPDPVYSLGKHAVVGFMRAIAPNLAPEGISVHTICPGITETGVLGDRRPLVESIGVPVMEPDAVCDAVLTAATAPIEASGSCWVVQHGKAPWPMEFPDVPGPDSRLNVPVTR